MRHAIIDPKDGKVVNVVVWEGKEWLPPRGYMVVQLDNVDIGDTWDDKNKQLIKAIDIAIE